MNHDPAGKAHWPERMSRYHHWVAAHPRVVLALALLVTALSAYTIVTRATIDTRTSNLLSKHLRYHVLNREFETLFPQQHEAIVLVLRGNSQQQVDRAARRLLVWLKRHPHTYHDPLDLGVSRFLRRASLLYLTLPELRMLSRRLIRAGPLLGRLAAKPTVAGFNAVILEVLRHHGNRVLETSLLAPVLTKLAQTIQRAVRDPTARMDWNRELIPTSQRFARARVQTIVTVRPTAELNRLRPYHAAVLKLRMALERLGIDRAHKIHVGWTGGATLADEQLATIGRGLGLALGLSLLVILVLVTMAVRSIRMTLAIILTLIMGLCWTTALATVFLGPFNLISIAFAVLFVGLGVDFGIQYGVRYLEELATVSGHDQNQALSNTGQGLAWPLTLAALATAISFYAFLPTNYSGIIDLGLVAGTSMFVAWFAYITLMPAWIVALGRSVRHPPLRHRLAQRYAAIIERRAKTIVLVAAIAALAVLPASSRVRFDFNPLHLMDRSSPAVRTFRSLAQHSRYSPYTINVLVHGVARVHDLARRLQAVPSVGRVLTLFSFIPHHQTAKRALLERLRFVIPPFSLRPDWRRYRRPTSGIHRRLKAFIAQAHRLIKVSHVAPTLRQPLAAYLHALEAYIRYHPSQGDWLRLRFALLGGLVNDLTYLSRALHPPRVTLTSLPPYLVRLFRAPGDIYRLEIFSRLNLSRVDALTKFVTSVRRDAPNAVGTPVMIVDGGRTVLHAFLEASMIALLSTALLLCIVLRKIREVLLVLITTLMSVAFTTATMWLTGHDYDLANIIVLPLLLGLSLVFGIYFILRWRRGIPMSRVLRSSLPRGILYSGTTTLGTFGSLMLASDPGVSSLGWALVIALTWVLIVTLVVLPSLLTLMSNETPVITTHGH